MVNISPLPAQQSIGELFQLLGVSPRLEILATIGVGEACVCHLEAALGYRQAYISQHLMALREAGLLDSRREGRFIYYRLASRRTLDLIALAGALLDAPVQPPELRLFSCECPNCSSAKNPALPESAAAPGPETQT
jgi:ArsR family transcriptional regulator